MSLKKRFLKSKPVCKVSFCLPADAANGAKKVKLVGEFNNWDKENGIPMKKKKDTYVAVLNLEKDKEFQFRYLLDNEKWQNDPAADKYLATPFGSQNCVVVT